MAKIGEEGADRSKQNCSTSDWCMQKKSCQYLPLFEHNHERDRQTNHGMVTSTAIGKITYQQCCHKLNATTTFRRISCVIQHAIYTITSVQRRRRKRRTTTSKQASTRCTWRQQCFASNITKSIDATCSRVLKLINLDVSILQLHALDGQQQDHGKTHD